MEIAEKKLGQYADSAEDGIPKKKRQNDRGIKQYASHSSFKIGTHHTSLNRIA
jgi:hypothetical protein